MSIELHPTLGRRSTTSYRSALTLGAEIDVDGMYHALLDRYRRIYGIRTYRSILEDEIDTLKAEGLSREEAVKKIFQKRIDLFKQ